MDYEEELKQKLILENPELGIVLDNIKKNQGILESGKGPAIVGLISGNINHKKYLDDRFNKTKIFHGKILSVLEETRKGNFLGTLNFYDNLKKSGLDFKDRVVLCGMVFGKGERLYPITNVLKNIKPSMPTPKTVVTEEGIDQETIIESALRYFSLTSSFLEEKGFRGILNKWGDEIQIPVVDLSLNNADFKNTDVVRFVSEMVVTPYYAANKEWVAYDKDNNFTRQITRRPIEEFEELHREGIVEKNDDGSYVCGANLGPVAVSYEFLEIALEIFKEELEREGFYFDFDPYFLCALPLVMEENGREIWNKERKEEREKINKMIIPNEYGEDLFGKLQSFVKKFEEVYDRSLNMKVVNLGDTYWADFGLHKTLRKNFMDLLEDTKEGFIGREIAGIGHIRDENGNIIVNSDLGGADVKNSVIINSKILSGRVSESVIVDSLFKDVDFSKSFSIGDRVVTMKSREGGGSVKTLSKDPVVVEEKIRCVSVPLKEGVFCFKVHEEEDLRDINKLEKAILNNKISFRDLWKAVDEMGFEEHEELRKRVEKEVLEYIFDKKVQGDFKSLSV
jgi:hypothetical protein